MQKRDTYVCMRTTLNLDDHLLAAAKDRAAAKGITLTAFIEDALAAALAPRPTQSRPYRFRWKTHKGRLRAGVDIADRNSLYDVMDPPESFPR